MNDIFSNYHIKRTTQRICILNALRDSSYPLTAEEISKQLNEISLATIYRTLELFCEKGIAKRHSLPSSDKNHYEFSAGRHQHYAICLGCHSLVQIQACPVNNFEPENFHITGHHLEFYGYCKNCQKVLNKK